MATQTQILKIDRRQIEADKIRAIAQVLTKEGVIAYPTDTFYGLGASCFSEKAIQRIYRLKKRKPSKPLSVLVSSLDMAKDIAVGIPFLFWELAREFWPGPLTIVLKASSRLAKELLGPGQTIGIRQPGLLWLQRLVETTSFPITATSANISGEEEISDPEKVIKIFSGRVDLIADGGKTPGGKPSTVISLVSSRPEILREGVIPRSRLQTYL